MTKEHETFGSYMRSFFHNWKGKGWFFLNMFCTVVYLIWRIFYTIPFGFGTVSVVAGISLLVVEVLGMVEAFIHFANMYSVEDYPFPENMPPERFPDVDVFIATYSEDVELLYKTIRGCTRMKYPDPSKVHIYLCDDGHRPEMKALAARMGINYLDREDHEGAKAGNLNNGLAHSNSPYVVTFDADMIPRSNFLMRTIPYFVDAELRNQGREEEDQVKIGFLQSPQSFYNLDLFQFNLYSESRIPNEQDYFYKDIQVARTRTNSVIYGGSNTVLSREALESIGGFYTKAITEDFATGILIERKQYVSLGTAEPLASGLSPQDLKDLIQQRTRWARGVIATGKNMRIFTVSDLSFSQKLNYWASIWYWYAPLKRLIYIMSPILYATFGFMVFKCTLPQVLLFWLPMYISSNVSLRMLSRNIRSTKWTNIYETVLFPYMLLPVLFETVGISMKKFKVTSKGEQKNEKGKNFLFAIPFLILIVLSVWGIIRCIMIMLDSGSFGPVVVLFWLVNNLYLLVMSLFFVDGRIPYRKSERVMVHMPCRVRYQGEEYTGETKDISETGISLTLPKPYFFEENTDVEIVLDTEDYHVDMFARVVHVSQWSEKWNYALKITDLNGSYDELLGILYDRIPTVPTEIKKDSGSFEDLKLNMQKRVVPPFYQKRNYPRVIIDDMVPCLNEGVEAVKVFDFNYVCLTVAEDEGLDNLQLLVKGSIVLNCQYETHIRKGLRLYNVVNYREVLSNRKNKNELLDWMMEESSRQRQQEKQVVETRLRQTEEFNEIGLLG
ncbi:MAG: glycosyltransferase [Lachnospiraceae bacterium]|nr:glycosyltransferase [Lachnospiraceae bacterium]